MAEKVLLEIIVNGQSTTIEANPNQPLRSVIGRALAQTGNTGQPPESWEFRDDAGNTLAVDARIEDLGLTSGQRLFLNLKAGVGG